MNRQQALGQLGDESLERAGINGLVNDIYDDFESQTCGNCRKLSSCVTREILFNEQPNFEPKSFGCNQFERTE